MNKILGTIFLIFISMGAVLSQYFNSPLDKINVVSASYNVYKAIIEPMCVVSTSSGQLRIFPTGQSMENLIALIERLEFHLFNDSDINLKQHLGADNTAKLLLRRFRFDGYNPNASSMPYQYYKDQNIVDMNNAIFTQNENTGVDPTYYFPDKFFDQAELCSLYYMLSHNVYNIAATDRTPFSDRFRRGNAVQTSLSTKHPIKEEGVVSFRGNQDEAIAAARVLTGVIAGLSTDMKTTDSAVLKVFKPNYNLPSDKNIDPVMAVTIADLWGFATERPGQSNERQYYYGVKGQWISGSCTTYYGLTDIQANQFPNATRNMKATKAELRGGLDGYLIGKNLKNLVISDMKSLRLSAILRSYYSKPKTQKFSAFTVSYCNRDQQINSQDLLNTASAYSTIMSVRNGINIPDPLLNEFNNALQYAQQKETNGFNDYCSQIPGGLLDKTAPCETPSDIIYVIDGQTTKKLQDSAKIATLINGNTINIGSQGGAVSIFFNSHGTNSVNPEAVRNNMPIGPNGWPFLPAAFNSTNTGSAQCRIDDFNKTNPQPVANTGKYLKYLNQTLFNFKHWNPRTTASGVPAKTAVLIDFDSVPKAPDSGADSDDYNYFKDQLKYRHRDVKFIAVTNNQDLFKDILRDQNDKEFPYNIETGASNLAKKICENPATFQYYACYNRSDNVEYTGFITPGYKQNWAMYPEFFHNSTGVKFTFKAEEGDIRVCYDRSFPPQRKDLCKDLNLGEEVFFNISNPCKGQSFQSCDPLYFTVWGKDRTSNTQCLDQRCLSLDQIKFTVRHTGVQCSENKIVIINKNETDIDLNNVLDNLKSLSTEEISTRIAKLDIALYKIEEMKNRYTADRQILLKEIIDRNK